MAIGVAGEGAVTEVEAGKKNYAVPLMLMVSLYFGIGFITAMNDILVPHFKDLFHLTNVKALLVQFCFFGAYFVMSVPSGKIVGSDRLDKSGIVVALTVMGLGLLLFLPASVIIFYPLFLFALFVVGSGLALLQVAINPYVGALALPGDGGGHGRELLQASSIRLRLRSRLGSARRLSSSRRALRRPNWHTPCGCRMRYLPPARLRWRLSRRLSPCPIWWRRVEIGAASMEVAWMHEPPSPGSAGHLLLCGR